MAKDLFRWVDGGMASHNDCCHRGGCRVYCSPLASCAFNLHCLEWSIEEFVFVWTLLWIIRFIVYLQYEHISLCYTFPFDIFFR